MFDLFLEIVLYLTIVIFTCSTIGIFVVQYRDSIYQDLYFNERAKWDQLYQSYSKIYKSHAELQQKYNKLIENETDTDIKDDSVF